MALIKCPQCENQISDKALECPSCGFKIIKKDEKEKEPIECEECGKEIPDGALTCPSCGNPVKINCEEKNEAPQKVEITNVNLPKLDKKKKNRIIITVVVVMLVIVGAVFAVNQHKAGTYKSNLELASAAMLTGASTAENAGGLIHDVWYNTIYEESDSSTDKYTKENSYKFYDDFNDSLAILFMDTTFIKKIDSIKESQETVNGLMKELMNPPEEYRDAYNTLKDYYDSYLDLTNLVIDPSGNLQSYTSNFNDADSEVLKCYKAMQLYTE